MKAAVVVVGSLNMDFVVTTRHLPAAGETVLGGDFRMVPGGKGANQACAAAKIGSGTVAVRMIGRVGSDIFADHLKASLSAAGVDVGAVHACRSQATGVALISVDQYGQNTIVVAPGANSALVAADVEAMRRVFRGASHALFQLETPLATVSAALALARSEGLVTILDPAPAQALPAEVLHSVDILTPNENEALTLAGRSPSRVALEDAPALVDYLRALGAREVVLKLGDRGCFHDGTHYPGYPVDACDTTAAGDVFNAALAVALAEGQPFENALPFANRAAAISVTRPGAQTSVPTRAEVDSFQRS
jgi:ribokinase